MVFSQYPKVRFGDGSESVQIRGMRRKQGMLQHDHRYHSEQQITGVAFWCLRLFDCNLGGASFAGILVLLVDSAGGFRFPPGPHEHTGWATKHCSCSGHGGWQRRRGADSSNQC